MKKVWVLGLLCLFTIVLSACGSSLPLEQKDDSLKTSKNRIINGAVVDPAIVGFVRITNSTSGNCSGVLLRNNRVLTAKHCFKNADINNPGGVSIRMNNQSATATGIFRHPTRDIATVWLSQRFIMNRSRFGFVRPLFRRSLASLVGTNVICFGFGFSTFTGGLGTPRRAVLPVSRKDIYTYNVVPNSAGQITWEGDSGGPCMSLATNGGLSEVSGIQSRSFAFAGTVRYSILAFTGNTAMRNWINSNI